MYHLGFIAAVYKIGMLSSINNGVDGSYEYVTILSMIFICGLFCFFFRLCDLFFRYDLDLMNERGYIWGIEMYQIIFSFSKYCLATLGTESYKIKFAKISFLKGADIVDLKMKTLSKVSHTSRSTHLLWMLHPNSLTPYIQYRSMLDKHWHTAGSSIDMSLTALVNNKTFSVIVDSLAVRCLHEHLIASQYQDRLLTVIEWSLS